MSPAFPQIHFSGPIRRAFYAVLAALLVVRLIAMWVVPFTDTTEARYGEMARKMLETGNWITPLYDYGVPFWGKPPLHTWLSAMGQAMFGMNEFGARMPILLTSFGVLALACVFARRMVGKDGALLLITVLAGGIMFFGATAFIMTDMVMVLGTTFVMVGFWFAACDGETPARERYLWGLAIFVGFAIGLMAKGPVAMVLCGIPTVLWILTTWRFKTFISIPWGWGIVILVALVAPWYALAEHTTPGFLRYFIIGEHYERFVVKGWEGDLYGEGHGRPKGAIWLFWLGTVLPWTPVYLALLLRPKRLVRAFAHPRTSMPAQLMWYLLFWTIGPMILFTPAANILPSYVLPGLPAAALLLVILYSDENPESSQLPISKPKQIGALIFSSLTAVLFAIFCLVELISPNTLNLPAHKSAVETIKIHAPDAQIVHLGERSYSAEFYTGGQIHHSPAQDLRLPLPNAAYIIARKHLAKLEPNVRAALFQVDTAGRYAVFLPHPINEAQNGSN